MYWKTFTMGLLLAAAASCSAIKADSPTPATATPDRDQSPAAQVPADAKWVIYLNLDRAMQMPGAAKLLKGFLRSHRAAKQTIGRIETLMGNKFPDDFHQAMIVGNKVGPNHGVLVIHATANQSHLNHLIELNSAASKMTIGNTRVNMIPASDRKGYTTFEASPAPGVFVASRSEHAIKHELDVLTGKAPGMAASNPLFIGLRDNVIVYLADADVAKLVEHRRGRAGPVGMKYVTSAWLAVRVIKKKLDIRCRIHFIHANTAAQMVQMGQGWQAMMDLGATNGNANPRQRFMAGIADRLNIGAIGKVIRVHWDMSLDKLLAGPAMPTSGKP